MTGKNTLNTCRFLTDSDSFISAIDGLPKSFRDQDIDVELPSDVDDDFVNSEEYLLSLPGEPTGMLLFLSLVKVVRVLSNTLEILYTTTDRRQTVTKIQTIDRLLDQWVHTLPDHLQLDPVAAQPPCDDTRIEPAVAFLHLTYFYVRFAAHRVAISFQPTAPQYRTSLLRCMEIVKEIICLNSHCQRHLLVLDVNPGSHVYTLWSCGLMSLFGLWEIKTTEGLDFNFEVEEDAKAAAKACVGLLKSLVASGRDEQVRVDNLMDIIAATWPDIRASATQTTQPPVSGPWPTTSTPQNPSQQVPTPFTQLLQPMYMDQTTPQPQHDLVSSNSRGNSESQSPHIPRLDVPATSPSLMESFNIDFSSAFSHAYERFQTNPLPVTNNPDTHNQGNSTMSAQQQHQQENTGQIWDDPVFNLTSMMSVVVEENINLNMNASSAGHEGQGQPSKKRARADVDSQF